MDYKKESLKKHLKFGGKIEIKSKFPPLKNRDDLSVAYTPGVAAESTLLAGDSSLCLRIISPLLVIDMPS